MRLSLVIALSLLSIARSHAVAQTCMGLASFSTAPLQVTANGQLSNLSTTFGTSVGYGIRSSVYGTLAASTTSYDGVDGSSLGLAAAVGYQMEFGRSQQLQVCPNASFGLGLGPNDDIGGVSQSSRSATIGLNIGTVLQANPRLALVPTAGFSYAHATARAENDAGSTLFEISDGYGLAQLGVGIILNQTISVRPSIDIPFGLNGTNPTVGLTLGYSFGRGSAARQ